MMALSPFRAQLAAAAREANSWLCIGLDPDPSHFPEGMGPEDTTEFCLGILESSARYACAVKPNAAFFEALGRHGTEALEEVVANVPPGMPVILDGKRNDIGNTAAKYAEAAFDELGADAVTVNPYLGRDTVAPFASYAEKGVFLLARTSNPSAGDFQDLLVGPEERLYQRVARQAMQWDSEWRNLGLVAGATYPKEVASLRSLCGPGIPFLVPGVGAQGADAATTLAAAADAQGGFAVINVGRAILQASPGPDWREAAAEAAVRFAKALPYKPA